MTVLFGTQCGARRVQDNNRFDWNVLDRSYSCYCCLAINQQASVLAMGLACLTVYYSLGLVSGCFFTFAACRAAVLLIILLCRAWEHVDNSNGDVPGLADGQGIAAVSVLLDWTGWNSSVNSSQRDCDLWMNPRGSRTPRSVCARG